MRISEALGVHLRDLHLDQAVIYLPKTKNGNAGPCTCRRYCGARRPAPREIAIRSQGGGPQHEDVSVAFLKRDRARRLSASTMAAP